jgi:hypothetical protein
MLAFDCVCLYEFVADFRMGLGENGVTSVQRVKGISKW